MEATQTTSQDQTGITMKIKTNRQEQATKKQLGGPHNQGHCLNPGRLAKTREGAGSPRSAAASAGNCGSLRWDLWPRLGPVASAGTCGLGWDLWQPRLGPVAWAGSGALGLKSQVAPQCRAGTEDKSPAATHLGVRQREGRLDWNCVGTFRIWRVL
uniref:Uncharacterized protein n=1 Tax=Molossus molossus TaxID=27622 RepID=A0A7J8DTR2_MOLMO|nr:hypothetical protein HJG59_009133 [Molossus molossus]